MEHNWFLEGLVKWLYNLTMHYPYNRDDDYVPFLIILLLFMLLAVFLLWVAYHLIYDYIDKRTSVKTEYTGNLVDKKYIGESDSSGTGTAMVATGSGMGIGLVSTSSHTDEDFLFFIKADKIYKCEVDMQNYYHFNIGDRINFSVLRGGKSGDQLEINLI